MEASANATWPQVFIGAHRAVGVDPLMETTSWVAAEPGARTFTCSQTIGVLPDLSIEITGCSVLSVQASPASSMRLTCGEP